jgi:hypothetical protein
MFCAAPTITISPSLATATVFGPKKQEQQNNVRTNPFSGRLEKTLMMNARGSRQAMRMSWRREALPGKYTLSTSVV